MTIPSSPANDLLRAAARLSHWASQKASFDVPFAQARLLSLVEEHAPVRTSSLATLDNSSQPTVTTQLQRMEAAGWVRRSADPADARASLISLTPQGSAALTRVRAARAAVLDPLLTSPDGPTLARVQVAVDVITELLALATRSPSTRKDG